MSTFKPLARGEVRPIGPRPDMQAHVYMHRPDWSDMHTPPDKLARRFAASCPMLAMLKNLLWAWDAEAAQLAKEGTTHPLQHTIAEVRRLVAAASGETIEDTIA